MCLCYQMKAVIFVKMCTRGIHACQTWWIAHLKQVSSGSFLFHTDTPSAVCLEQLVIFTVCYCQQYNERPKVACLWHSVPSLTWTFNRAEMCPFSKYKNINCNYSFSQIYDWSKIKLKQNFQPNPHFTNVHVPNFTKYIFLWNFLIQSLAAWMDHFWHFITQVSRNMEKMLRAEQLCVSDSITIKVQTIRNVSTSCQWHKVARHEQSLAEGELFADG